MLLVTLDQTMMVLAQEANGVGELVGWLLLMSRFVWVQLLQDHQILAMQVKNGETKREKMTTMRQLNTIVNAIPPKA